MKTFLCRSSIHQYPLPLSTTMNSSLAPSFSSNVTDKLLTQGPCTYFFCMKHPFSLHLHEILLQFLWFFTQITSHKWNTNTQYKIKLTSILTFPIDCCLFYVSLWHLSPSTIHSLFYYLLILLLHFKRIWALCGQVSLWT